MHTSISRDSDGHIGGETIARNVVDGHLSVLVQDCGHGSYGSFDPVSSRPDPTHEMQRCDQADGSVPAHPQITHVIKKDHTSSTIWIDWLAQQRTYNNIRAARFVDHRGAEAIVLGAKATKPLGQASFAEVRSAAHHQACGFAAGMGVDHSHSLSLACVHWNRVPLRSEN